jgi:hypothetical protein
MSSFENRGYTEIRNGVEKTVKPFPEVDSRFKFTIVNIIKQPSHPFMTFDAKFYLHNPKELEEKESIAYNLEMMKKFSPDNLSIMEFRTKKDYSLCSKVRGEHKLFGDLGFKLSSEFHMTNDSHLFHKESEIEKNKEKEKYLHLYEGKMIHQFNSNYSEARYFINEDEAKPILVSIERNNIKRKLELDNDTIEKLKIKLDYQDYRLIHRAVGRSTDERTIICTLVPPKVYLGHSLNYLVNFEYEFKSSDVIPIQIPKEDLIFLMSLFNSLTLNYYIRNKISANLTMNFMYELPIPKATKEQKEYLVNLGFTLLYLHSQKEDYDKLLKQLKIKIDKKADPIKIRSEIEVYIAKELYNLSKEDWQYLTSTFIYGANSHSKHELDQIIEQSHLLWS